MSMTNIHLPAAEVAIREPVDYQDGRFSIHLSVRGRGDAPSQIHDTDIYINGTPTELFAIAQRIDEVVAALVDAELWPAEQ